MRRVIGILCSIVQMCFIGYMSVIWTLMQFDEMKPQYNKYVVISFIVFCVATCLEFLCSMTSGNKPDSTCGL